MIGPRDVQESLFARPAKRARLERFPLDAERMARRTDPISSVEAAVGHIASGKLTANLLALLQLVTAYPDSTAVELCEKTTLERHEVSRRLPDLRMRGLVYNGEPRDCKVNGSRMLTWCPVRIDQK